VQRVLIIGGYGNFGRFISKTLALEPNIQLIIAGRNLDKAKKLATTINSHNKPEAIALDIRKDLTNAFNTARPNIVIHTSGPFQTQDYKVAETCIQNGVHYIDLADGRDFVTGISRLDEIAKQQNVAIISGASSVPCLTSALVDSYQTQFNSLETLDYGITTAQRTARGLATTTAILSYTGKAFHTLLNGKHTTIYGWQGLKARRYSKLGWRLLEIPFIHLALWGCSWLVRLRLINKLEKSAPLFLQISSVFDWLGSSNSAFHMELKGKDKQQQDKTITFELTAKSGDGPYIPCMPAILIAKKLANAEIDTRGAQACIGLINRDEYLSALSALAIRWQEKTISH